MAESSVRTSAKAQPEKSFAMKKTLALFDRTDSVLGELICQGATGKPHTAGCLRLCATGSVQRSQDEFFLCALQKAGKVERICGRNGDRVGASAISPGRHNFLLYQGQIVCADFKVARENVSPLYQIPKLTQVSWEAILPQFLQRSRAQMPTRHLQVGRSLVTEDVAQTRDIIDPLA